VPRVHPKTLLAPAGTLSVAEVVSVARSFERRVKHYEEAVVKNIDRPRWHPEKATDMFDAWKDRAAIYADLDNQVKAILAEAGVPTVLRGLYLSFARAAFKKIVDKKASKRDIDALVAYWAANGLDKKVLDKIVKFIAGNYAAGTRG